MLGRGACDLAQQGMQEGHKDTHKPLGCDFDSVADLTRHRTTRLPDSPKVCFEPAAYGADLVAQSIRHEYLEDAAILH